MKRSLWLLLWLLFITPPAIAGQAVLTWDPPTTNMDGTPLTDLGGYKAYWGTTSGNYGSVISVGNVLTYTTTGLPDGTYYFAVTAYDIAGNESDFSNEVSKTITSVAIPAPTALQATGNGGIITLSWDKPNYANIAGYQISKGTSAGLYSGSYEVGTAQASSTPCVISYISCVRRQFVLYNIKPGIYYFAVKGYDNVGSFSVYSNEASVTLTSDATLPADVTNFTATKITDTSIRLSWTNPSDPDFSGLVLEYTFGTQTTYAQIATLKGLPGAPQTYDHKNLITGTYNYKIHTYDVSGNVTSTRYASLKLDNTTQSAPPQQTTQQNTPPPKKNKKKGGGFGCGAIKNMKPPDGGGTDVSALALAAIPLIFFARRRPRPQIV